MSGILETEKFNNCPLCEGRRLDLTNRDLFNSLVQRTGSGCVEIKCLDCYLGIIGFASFDERGTVLFTPRTYDDLVEEVRRKWNRLKA